MNINESVIIKLNETGMSILRAEHAELKQAFPSLHDFVEIEADEDGLYPKKMQLWSVMQTFGHHINLGANPPFSTEIETNESDEVSKLKLMNKELLAALEMIASSKPILMHDERQREVVVYNLEFNPAKISREAIAKAKAAS